MYLNPYKVESYGVVKPNQNEILNKHLKKHLETFDEEYKVQGGVIGSPGHEFERIKIAKTTSESLLKSLSNKYNEINELNSYTKHKSDTLNLNMEIATTTRLVYDG